jgi:predicted RND superfamily exporter protein
MNFDEAEPSMTSFEQIAEAIAGRQVSRPTRCLIAAAILTVIAGLFASKLTLDSSYEALLPEKSTAIVEARAVRDLTGGVRQLVIALGGRDEQDQIVFGRELLAALKSLGDVRDVELEYPVEFIRQRGLWLTDIATLDTLIEAVEQAVHAEKELAFPLALHLDEDGERRNAEEAWQRAENIIRGARESSGTVSAFRRSQDGRFTFLTVIPHISFSDMAAGRAFLERVQRAVASLSPESHGIEVKYAGALPIYQETHSVMRSDLRIATLVAFFAVFFLVSLSTKRWLSPFVLGVSLVPGIVWALAIAGLTVQKVNVITGFSVAVLLGLGVDFGVHLFIRFRQETASYGKDVDRAVVAAVRGTAWPALMSALSTAGVFFLFTISDFRGFSELGWITGTGVVLSFLSTYTILPPLLALWYRRGLREIPKSHRDVGDQVFVYRQRSGRIVWFVVALFLGAAYAGVWWAPAIRFSNDLRALRGESPATTFTQAVESDMNRSFDPAVILTRSEEDARVLAVAARSRAKKINPDARLKIGRVSSVTDLLPSEISEHRSRIERLSKRLNDARLDKGLQDKGDRAETLKSVRGQLSVEPWTVSDLPDVFRRRFLTTDGAGFVTYVWPQETVDTDIKAREWKKALEGLSDELTAKGVEHRWADESLLLAWIDELVRADGPRLLCWAAALVFAILLAHLRSLPRAILVATPLAVGMGLFSALIAASGTELNMYNMMILPSIVGIGIDNAIHIYHRYRTRGASSLESVMSRVGAGIAVASLTTAAGFGSLLVAHNAGLRSFGSLAVLGVLSTFLSAVVFFPALLSLLAMHARRSKGSFP